MDKFLSLTDEELVACIRGGDPGAEEALILRYTSYVRSFTRPYFLVGGDSEDLIQEGLLGLIRAVSEFDASRDVTFKTFAIACVRNRVYSAIRNSNREKNAPLRDFVSLESLVPDSAVFPGAFPDPAEDIINREAYAELLKEAEGKLSKLEREILGLYLEGISYAEISERLSKKPKSVDNAIQRIRKKLLRYRK
ncbi:MAG: sigma-70 family RNA polymerase sigma factor [Oscillospiraceae bacterium]|nr:sigma-70 family RNA polymerase sigma factor [Oscillospiraceae bacterium]